MGKSKIKSNAKYSAPRQELELEKKVEFPLTKLNFILMGVAGLLIIVGFLLMTGSPSTAENFNPDIFSTRRVVVGPTIAFIGFLFMGFAIMWKQKGENTDPDPVEDPEANN